MSVILIKDFHFMVFSQYSSYINTNLLISVLRVDDNSLTNLYLRTRSNNL
jgi:hypothetical protein